MLGDEQREIEELNEELLRRQIHPRYPTRAREALNQLMARSGYGQTQSNQQREQVWQQAVGQPLASHSRAVRLSRGVLTVLVSNSAIMQELTFQQQQLVEKIKELNSDLKVRSIRFRVGAIS